MGSKNMGYEATLVRSFSRMKPQKLGVAVVAGCFAVFLVFIAVFRPSINPSQIRLRLMMFGSSPTMVVAEIDATSSTRLDDVRINNSTMDNKQHCREISPCPNDKGDSVQEESPILSVPSPQEPVAKDSQLLADDGRDHSTTENSLECDGSLCQDEKGSVEANSVVPVPNPGENVTTSSTLLDDSASPNMAPEAEMICDPKSGLCEADGDSDVHQTSTQLGNQNKTQEADLPCDPQAGICKLDEDSGSRVGLSLLKSGGEANTKSPMQTRKPLCDTSNRRFDVCDMVGDVRILGQSSSIVFVDDSARAPANESWRVRPYSRKGDNTALGHVRELLVSSSSPSQGGSSAAAPHCAVRHGVPAVVFSVAGYTGNFFHDFADVLIPLFLTSRQFEGEVQFLVSDFNTWWVNKYRLIFNQLSRYEVVNLDKEDRVHCFPRAIVGLWRHKELGVDPSKPPLGNSMADFSKFLRTSFSLERDRVTRVEEALGKKPRLLIISRKRTRSLTNVKNVAQMARGLGFEVVVGEMGASSNVASFARLVNSCDVLVGVHGAGLTNMVFLPTNGTLVQIVPWGGLESISRFDFGFAAGDARLRYLEYSIKEEESSLIEQYPRDHPVFKDPLSIHKQGWNALRSVYLDKQNVKLDVERFRSVLLQVLDTLRH